MLISNDHLSDHRALIDRTTGDRSLLKNWLFRHRVGYSFTPRPQPNPPSPSASPPTHYDFVPEPTSRHAIVLQHTGPAWHIPLLGDAAWLCCLPRNQLL
jgi:hypothetical protein